jgi:hypothetical protein
LSPYILPHIAENYQNVVLCVDFFYVQGHIFPHTISRDINFRTVSHVTDRRHVTMLSEVGTAIMLYQTRGFQVTNLHCDPKFDCLRSNIHLIQCNVVAKDSHVDKIERSTRVPAFMSYLSLASPNCCLFLRSPMLPVTSICSHPRMVSHIL